jgi:CspA family cold shock protein
MSEGTVKWFNPRKGYGFIATEDGRDIFVHYASISGDGYKTLSEGDSVTFDIAEGEKGLRAENVVQQTASQSKSGSESKPAEEGEAVSESEEDS